MPSGIKSFLPESQITNSLGALLGEIRNWNQFVSLFQEEFLQVFQHPGATNRDSPVSLL